MKFSSRQIQSEVRALYGRHLLPSTGPSPVDGAASEPIMAEARDFYFEVARGKISGMRIVSMIGVNDTLPNGTAQTLWPTSGIINLQTSEQSIEVVSTSPDDAAGGTGAQTLLIRGLNGNLEEVTETVPLAGTTPVVLLTQMQYVNRSFITSVGSGGVNAGNIETRVAGGGDLQRFMLANSYLDKTAVFTVPKDKKVYVMNHFVSTFKDGGGGAGSVSTALLYHPSPGSIAGLSGGVRLQQDESFDIERVIPGIYMPGWTLEIRVEADSTNLSVTSLTRSVLVDDSAQ